MMCTCDCFNEIADVEKLFGEYHKLLCKAIPAAVDRYGQSCDQYEPGAIWGLQ